MTTPATPTPPAAPPAMPTIESVAQALVALFIKAATAALGDWAPSLITAAILIFPLAHPALRPHTFTFLVWLRDNGVDAIGLLERLYGYTLTTVLNRWLRLAFWANLVCGAILSIFVLYPLEGTFHEHSQFLFVLALGLVQLGLWYGRRTVRTANGTPSKAELDDLFVGTPAEQTAKQTAFATAYGRRTSPIIGILMLLLGTSIVAMADGLFIASAETALESRGYAVLFSYIHAGLVGGAFLNLFVIFLKVAYSLFRGIVFPVTGISRKLLVLLFPGLTSDNEDEVFGYHTRLAALAFVGFLLPTAIAYLHPALALVLSVKALCTITGLCTVAIAGAYLAYASEKPTWGANFTKLVGGFYLGLVLWKGWASGYWGSLEALGGVRTTSFVFTTILAAIAVVITGGIGAVFGSLIGNFIFSDTQSKERKYVVVGLAVAFAVPCLILTYVKLKTAARDPNYAMAAQHAVSRGVEVANGTIERETWRWVARPTENAQADAAEAIEQARADAIRRRAELEAAAIRQAAEPPPTTPPVQVDNTPRRRRHHGDHADGLDPIPLRPDFAALPHPGGS